MELVGMFFKLFDLEELMNENRAVSSFLKKVLGER